MASASSSTSLRLESFEDAFAESTRNHPGDPLLDFPSDDVELQVIPTRPVPIGTTLTPEQEELRRVDEAHMSTLCTDSLSFFQAKQVVITHKNKEFVSALDTLSHTVGKIHYEGEIFPSRQVEPEDNSSNLATLVPETADLVSTFENALEAQAPSEERLLILSRRAHNDPYCWNGGAEWELGNRASIVGQQFGSTDVFQVVVDRLDLMPQWHQPVFASLAFFEFGTGQRVTENFIFDFNPPEISNLLDRPLLHPATQSKRALVRFRERYSRLFVVIRVFKVLSGDEDKSADPFVRPDRYSRESDLGKLRRSCEEQCKVLGRFRQPLCWGFDVVNLDGLRSEPDQSLHVNIAGFFRSKGNTCDMDCLNWIRDAHDKSPHDKAECDRLLGQSFKVVDGQFIADVQRFVDEGRDLRLLEPHILQDAKQPQDYFRLVQDFCVLKGNPEPNMSFRNELFVYPSKVFFHSNKIGKSSTRNVAIRVQLREYTNSETGFTEEPIYSDGIPCILGQSVEGIVLHEAYTQVTYHNRHPDFSDEFHLRLPLALNKKHHLLFTFVHIQCKEGSKSKNQANVESLIGYSVLPLIHDGVTTVRSGTFDLPIATCEQAFYRGSGDDIPWLPRDKASFHVRLQYESTVNTEDSNLANLEFHLKKARNDRSYLSTFCGFLETIPSIKSQVLVNFAPLLLQQLTEVMAFPSKDIRKHAFAGIIHIVKVVKLKSGLSATSRNETLSRLVSRDLCPQGISAGMLSNMMEQLLLFFNHIPDEVAMLSSRSGPSISGSISASSRSTRGGTLTAEDLRMLRGRETELDESPVTKETGTLSWYLFDSIIRLATLLLAESQTLQSEKDRRQRLPAEFLCALDQLTIKCACAVYSLTSLFGAAKQTCINYALFLRDLLPLCDRGRVLQQVDRFLRTLDESLATDVESAGKFTFSIIEFKFDFMRVFSDYEYFLPLCLPVAPTFEEDGADLAESTLNKSFAGGIFIRFITQYLVDSNLEFRKFAQDLLYDILTKLELDERYQAPSSKTQIANLFFPLVILFLDLLPDYMRLTRQPLEPVEAQLRSKVGARKIARDKLESLQKELSKKRELDLGSDGTSFRSSFGPGDRLSVQLDLEKKTDQSSQPAPVLQLLDQLNDFEEQIAELEKEVKEKTKEVDNTHRKLFVCLGHILGNVDREYLRFWWSSTSVLSLEKFLDMLLILCQHFTFPGFRTLLTQVKRASEESRKVKASFPGDTSSGGKSSGRAFRSAPINRSKSSAAGPSVGRTPEDARRILENQMKNAGSSIGGSISGRSRFRMKKQEMAANSSSTFRASIGGNRNSLSIPAPGNGSGTTGRGTGDFSQGTRLLFPDEELCNSLGRLEDDVEDMSKAEAWICSEVGLVVVSIILELVMDRSEIIEADETETSCPKVTTNIVAHLLTTSQSEQVLNSMAGFLRFFIHHFRSLIYSRVHLATMLCDAILRRCTVSSPQNRRRFGGLLYLLFKNNYEIRANTARTTVLCTTALSTLVPKLERQEELVSAFDLLSRCGTVDPAPPVFSPASFQVPSGSKSGMCTVNALHEISPSSFSRQDFDEKVSSICVRLSDILINSWKVESLKKKKGVEEETIANMYFRISEDYSHVPDLRLTSLLNLAEFHKKSGNIAERALCYVLIADLILSFLQHESVPCVQHCSVDVLISVCPILQQLEKRNEWKLTYLQQSSDDIFQHSLFDREGATGLIKMVEKAISLFAKGDMFEFSIRLFKILIPIYEFNRQYQKLSEAYAQLATHCSNTYDALLARNRALGSYYYVTYEGEVFGELNHCSFIYKMPKITKLGEVMEKFTRLFEPAKLCFVSQREDAKVDPEADGVVRLAFVQPYFPPEEAHDRKTDFERITNIRTFLMEMGVAEAGSASSDSLESQGKMKTFIPSQYPFPAPITRASVLQKDILRVRLSPLEKACENIQAKNESLLLEICRVEEKRALKQFFSLSNLQMGIQGSVLLQVNVGAQEIVRTFLTDPSRFEESHIVRLQRNLREFLDVCRRGLRLLDTVEPATTHEFTRKLLEGYQEIAEFFEPYITKSPRGE